MPALRDSQVLVLDCQATAPSLERGFLLELGWATLPSAAKDASVGRVFDVRLRAPAGAKVPPQVARLTGLSLRDLAQGVEPAAAWQQLAAVAREHAAARDAPTALAVAHFARFEEGLLRDLHARCGDARAFPLELVCAHEIARRLLPALPRRSLRALAGYFGLEVGPLRRSGAHVEATAAVWPALVEALGHEGIETLPVLRAWLGRPAARAGRRCYPMPRETRLAAPDGPGVYRMLRLGGAVLYVGKATSLRRRVNQHFQKQSRQHERALELLSQARELELVPTETVLEAALLEADEIKRLRPPYNVALLEAERSVWFASSDLRELAPRPGARFPVGPFVAPEPPEGLGALAALLASAGGGPSAVVRGRCVGVRERWAPDEASFAGGLAAFRELHAEAVCAGSSSSSLARLCRLGCVLWERSQATARIDDDDPSAAPAPSTAGEPTRASSWEPAAVVHALETTVIRGAHALRRARWLRALSEATVRWHEPSLARGMTRALVLHEGEVVWRGSVGEAERAPPAPGCARGRLERQRSMTVARLDRLRVLTTELRRLLAHEDPAGAEVRLGEGRSLRGVRLVRALRWV